MRFRFQCAIAYALAFIVLSGSAGVSQAQTGNSVTYSGSAPLYDLARKLQDRYVRPVTLENALQQWPGELERLPHGGITESTHSIVLRESDSIFGAPALSLNLVQKALSEFHQQNPNRSRFKVIESKLGFHIVPTDAHDRSGRLQPTRNALDMTVYIPTQTRTFTEHLTALVDAVSTATGVQFTHVLGNLDAKYAANGYFFPYPQWRSDNDRQYTAFQWGANGTIARDALIELLAGSQTTMTWLLAAGPDKYALIVNELEINKRPLYLDRCTQCVPIPSQQGKTSQQVEAARIKAGK